MISCSVVRFGIDMLSTQDVARTLILMRGVMDAPVHIE